MRRGWDPPPPPRGEGAEGCGSAGDGSRSAASRALGRAGGRAGARRGCGPGGGTEGPGQPGPGAALRLWGTPGAGEPLWERGFSGSLRLQGEAPAIAVL